MADAKISQLPRCLTPTEIARFIVAYREEKGWTQEVLAELSGLTVRTIQRVERAEPSSADTRRALARAMEWDDIDRLNKPWIVPDVEEFEKERQRLEQETTLISVNPIRDGRHIRELAEQCEAFQWEQVSDLSPTAERAFAELQELFRDYGECEELYTSTQKLDVNSDFQSLYTTILREGFELGFAGRSVILRWENHETAAKVPLKLMYLVIAARTRLPLKLRVLRKEPFR